MYSLKDLNQDNFSFVLIQSDHEGRQGLTVSPLLTDPGHIDIIYVVYVPRFQHRGVCVSLVCLTLDDGASDQFDDHY